MMRTSEQVALATNGSWIHAILSAVKQAEHNNQLRISRSLLLAPLSLSWLAKFVRITRSIKVLQPTTLFARCTSTMRRARAERHDLCAICQKHVSKGRSFGLCRAYRSWDILVHAGTCGYLARDFALASPLTRTLTDGLSKEPG
jgi:hypothetical protein